MLLSYCMHACTCNMLAFMSHGHGVLALYANLHARFDDIVVVVPRVEINEDEFLLKAIFGQLW